MKYSLVSREVIADAIETARAAASAWTACSPSAAATRTCPARMIAHGAPERAGASSSTAAPSSRATGRARTWTIVSRLRGGRRVHRRQDGEGGLRRHRAQGAARRRLVRRHVHRQHHVVVDRGDGHVAAGSSHDGRRRTRRSADSAAESAQVLVEAVKQNLKPRDIITRKSIENAITLVMATGGSTNAVLHLLAIAHAAGVRVDARRLRAHPQQGAGALRPEALGTLRRDRPAPRRRHPAGAEDAARRTASCTATA